MKKLTNVLALEMVLGMNEVKGNAELVAKLETMKAQFEKKSNSGTKSPTKTQKENEGLKEIMLEVLSKIGEPIQIKELIPSDERLKSFTGQKLSALANQMVKDGILEKIADKKVSKFQIVK